MLSDQDRDWATEAGVAWQKTFPHHWISDRFHIVTWQILPAVSSEVAHKSVKVLAQDANVKSFHHHVGRHHWDMFNLNSVGRDSSAACR